MDTAIDYFFRRSRDPVRSVLWGEREKGRQADDVVGSALLYVWREARGGGEG